MASTTTKAKVALELVTRDAPVFPLLPGEKKPLTAHGFHDATTDTTQVESWWHDTPQANIGIATGAAGLVVLDIDVKNGAPGDASWAAIVAEHPELEDTRVARTPSGGRHYYFRGNGDRIRSSVSKLAPGIDVRAEGGYVVAPGSETAEGRYEWLSKRPPAKLPAWLAERLRTAEREPVPATADTVPVGRRNEHLAELAITMRRRFGSGEAAIAAALLEENKRCAAGGLAEAEVRAMATRIAAYAPGAPVAATETWPAPLGEAAYHGPIGALALLWEPVNEADPAAMLLTMLAGFGSICGSKPHAAVGDDRHPGRLFVLIVGESAIARKGMSSGPPLAALTAIDPQWAEDCVANGLSTGEGLIHRVRSPVWEKVPGKKPRRVDAGAADKRLLVWEGELARMFAVMAREGSTLSSVIRSLYDSGKAETLTKNPYSTSDAHVSIVAHITQEELREKLTNTDAASGFANRFLFCCARRQRLLPFGGRADPEELAPHICALQEAAGDVRAGHLDGVVGWGADARPLWEEVYPGLTSDASGMAGKILGRGQSQALRLAVIYALADGSAEIRPVHLEAALAVWTYCASSVRCLFGGRTGSSTADVIEAALCEGDLTRTQISALFDRHGRKAQIDDALRLLQAMGRAHRVRHEASAGRPAELWRAGPEPDDGGDDA